MHLDLLERFSRFPQKNLWENGFFFESKALLK